jgi:RNA polymerase sigma-70 factor (ECF subfamily)
MRAGEVRRDDEGLVAEARQGDAAAFSELVNRHQHEVYTLALRLTSDRDLAADVAQEALVRAWRALPRFRGEARFSTWLHRITVNTAWSQRARARRHRHESIDEVVIDLRADETTPEDWGEAADLRPRLLAALRELPAGMRAVVVLKDVQGWSHGEIAEALDITVTAAKVRLHRGRRRLRDRLFSDGHVAEAEVT